MPMKKTNDDFDTGFYNMMSSAMEYESLRRQGKPIPIGLQRQLDKAGDWLNNLFDEEYSRLIH